MLICMQDVHDWVILFMQNVALIILLICQSIKLNLKTGLLFSMKTAVSAWVAFCMEDLKYALYISLPVNSSQWFLFQVVNMKIDENQQNTPWPYFLHCSNYLPEDIDFDEIFVESCTHCRIGFFNNQYWSLLISLPLTHAPLPVQSQGQLYRLIIRLNR